MSATKRPWHREGNVILSESGEHIASVVAGDTDEELVNDDAELIVRAVNTHDELVQLVTRFWVHLQSHATFGLNHDEVQLLCEADRILALARKDLSNGNDRG